MQSRLRLIVAAFVLVILYFLVYPDRIELSGDQTASVIAAQSLLRDGSYRVPLHESYGPETSVEIGADLRQKLKWYPPGYTLALYALARLGLTLAAAALVIFYAAKLAWTFGWLAAGAAFRIPESIIFAAVAFSLVLTYPSTTTEIFESTGVALVFLALSARLGEPGSALLASVSSTAATLFRFAGIKLAAFYGLAEVLRRPRMVTFVKASLACLPPLAVYEVCTRVLGGESSPYHGVGPGPHTNWLLLLKGTYYAAVGGWTSTWWLLKPLPLVLVTMAAVGCFYLRRKGSPPDWILLLIGFQVYYLIFLIYVQIAYGSMYAPAQPAFATPRFFALTQPFNVAALLFLARFALPPAYPVLRKLPALILLAVAVDWTLHNRALMAAMAVGPDGFLRFADIDAAHRMLRAEHVDAVFDGTGVLMYTAVDPRIVYPDNVRSVHSANPAQIAIVRLKDQPDELLNDLEKQITPYQVKQFDRFEVDLFRLAPDFNLSEDSHRGFVPHLY